MVKNGGKKHGVIHIHVDINHCTIIAFVLMILPKNNLLPLTLLHSEGPKPYEVLWC